MGTLTDSQLSQAKQYIEANGNGRNPISVIMEIGQLLHIRPEFETFEPKHSTAHLHVFVCDVKFGNSQVRVEGYNKKRVKTEVAKKMIERLMEASNNRQLQGDTQKVQVRSILPREQHQPMAYKTFDSNPPVSQSTEATGNAVGILQEYCTIKRLDFPVYTFEKTSDCGSKILYSAKVKVQGLPAVQSDLSSSKSDAKQSAAHKLYLVITKEDTKIDKEDTKKIEATGESYDINSLQCYLKNLVLAVDEKPATAEAKPKVQSRIVSALKELRLDESQIAHLQGKGLSALEKLTMMASLKDFDINFHCTGNANGTSHLCLVEAKFGESVVCHGIADNEPQAMENAADSMLSLLSFFSN